MCSRYSASVQKIVVGAELFCAEAVFDEMTQRVEVAFHKMTKRVSFIL